MSALPRPANSLARRSRQELSRIAHILPRFRILQPLTLSPSEAEHGINQWRPKRPLRNEHPPGRNNTIPHDGIDPPPAHPIAKAGMKHQKHGEGERGPEPSDFDEVDVEHILLLRKVRGRELGDVRLRDGRVGRAS